MKISHLIHHLHAALLTLPHHPLSLFPDLITCFTVAAEEKLVVFLQEMQARDPEEMLSQENIEPLLALQEEFSVFMQQSNHQSHGPHSRFVCLFFVLRGCLNRYAAQPEEDEEDLSTTEEADFLGEVMSMSDEDEPSARIEGAFASLSVMGRGESTFEPGSPSFLPAPRPRSGVIYVADQQPAAVDQDIQPQPRSFEP
jgi:hypothetical protein